MPIYEYACKSCGFAKDVLQKMSDAPLTLCSECNQETFVKKISAAGFRLSGSGWYQTDSKSNKKTEAGDAKTSNDTGKKKEAVSESKPAKQSALNNN